MTGESMQGMAAAFAQLVRTLLLIVHDVQGVTVLVILALIAMGLWIWRLRRILERAFAKQLADLAGRLSSCESRHSQCSEREHRNILAIAALYGILKGIESSLPDHVHIPSLDQLFSGQWTAEPGDRTKPAG